MFLMKTVAATLVILAAIFWLYTSIKAMDLLTESSGNPFCPEFYPSSTQICGLVKVNISYSTVSVPIVSCLRCRGSNIIIQVEAFSTVELT